MKDNDVRFYKNKRRNEVEKHQPYVPQHVVLGVEPKEMNFGSGLVSETETVSTSKTKPVLVQFKPVNQPYAETVDSPIGASSVPNVGNNMEHTWSSVDGDIIDDLPKDFKADQSLIDNNEFVTDAAFANTNVSFGGNVRNRNPFSHIAQNTPSPSFQEVVHDDLLSVVKDLEPDIYLLLVDGNALCSGPLQEIEEQVMSLIVGNHELFDGQSVAEDKIIVLKKIKIKVGVFLV